MQKKKTEKWMRYYTVECITIALIILFRFIYYKNIQIATTYPDSASYMGFGAVLSGARTPGYPLFVEACRLLTGDTHHLTGVVLFQTALSLTANCFLYKAVTEACNNRRIGCITALLWGCCPGVISWDVLILSESCSLSITILFLYYAVRYLKIRDLKNGTGMILTAFAATWIKPSMAVYTMAVLGLLVIQYFMGWNRKRTLLLAGAAGICVGIYLLYAYRVYMVAGTFNLTFQGPRHMLASCLRSGVYKHYPDASLVEAMERIFAEHEYSISYTTTTPIMKLFGDNWIEANIAAGKFNSYCIRADFPRYMRYLSDLLWNNMNVVYTDSYAAAAYEGRLYQILMELQKVLFTGPKIGHVYILGVISLLLTVKRWIRTGECPYIWLGVCGLTAGIFLSVYIGTYSEFMRSTVYVLPFFYFGLGMLLWEFLGDGRILRDGDEDYPGSGDLRSLCGPEISAENGRGGV